MSQQIRFSDNYHDLSTDSGFQFEFYCERCHEAWRSPFDRYGAGTVENVLGMAEGLFGGVFGSARGAAARMKSAGWSSAKDTALKDAVRQAQEHFHRCPRCSNHFCDNCWNADEGTCITCVPRLEAEVAAITREAKLHKAREVAYEKATVSDDELTRRVVSCPNCNAAVGKAKFCPECGTSVALTRSCPDCSADVPSASKFCPECGKKM
jgi:membrane protease subunit (stomatin/prohibitin family)